MGNTLRLLRAAAVGAGVAVTAQTMRRRRRIAFLDRVVVISGGSRGLGLVLARQLADEGAKLALLARNAEDLARAAQMLAPADVLTLPCDVRDEAQVQAAIRQVLERWGRIDVLINNAGVIQVGPLEHMSNADFRESLDVHFWGAYHCLQAVIPHMRGRGGRIANITSIGGKIAVPHLTPYCAGKFALVGLSDGMRAELRKDRIYITTVVPGLMRTGSPPNAIFKGRHRQEYAWFAISDALPGLSIDAERAAQQIIEALRYGDASLTITLPAKIAVAANALLPNLVATITALATRLLPRPTRDVGDQRRSGWESQSALAPSLLTTLSDQATVANNELRTQEAPEAQARQMGAER